MTETPDRDRRNLLIASALAAVAGGMGWPIAALAQDAGESRFAQSGPFARSTVADIARALAEEAYVAPDATLPPEFTDLTTEQYSAIAYRPEAAAWADAGLPFQMQLFHRGFAFTQPVEVAIVTDGQATHLSYNAELFAFGAGVTPPATPGDIGFSGIRLFDVMGDGGREEVATFQGASYFRAVGSGQVFGLSARGLALNTASAEGEEFPIFRAFWVETPVAESEAIVIHALLDSVSTTGAYRFTIRPGLPTLMDVEVQLFPRVDLERLGLAPATSMFYFSANDRDGIDDYRPEAHDSDGLFMFTGREERVWRPLANPTDLQISAFVDVSPRGFGLIQRNRDFARYQDIDGAFERRPSLWIEPLGDWGAGAVVLVEIPSDSEINDNVVAYWAPRSALPAGEPFSFAYRLFWGEDPQVATGSARVGATRSGLADGGRIFVIDYLLAPDTEIQALGEARAEVTASRGEVTDIVLQQNPETGGWRLHFTLDTLDETLIELRALVTFASGPPAETWIYRWTV
jgi:glucans biosynthesis protein